jgi:predicted transposase
MLQSLMLRLETTDADKSRLLKTMKIYNEACNFVTEKAYSLKLANKYKLHKEVYQETRREVRIKQSISYKNNWEGFRSVYKR